MSSILLLDLDHTLYPSTAPTLAAVDARITRFIETRLDLSADRADQMRRDLCAEHGTTLRGLEILHGVGRGEYTDFIQDLEDHLMPAPDPRLRAWLITAAQRLPIYLFTNARRDWADRCLGHLGLTDLLRESPEAPALLGGILDIDFMEWAGKPHREAFEKAERYLAERHPATAVNTTNHATPGIVFADDRLDNLAAARARGWRTVWVRPHDAVIGAPPGLGADHRIVDRLTDLDPEDL